MKKKIFLMLTMVLLLVCFFAITVSADECIDGIYYTLNGTEATVSSANQKSCELVTVVIPEKITVGGAEYTVTAIAGKAFGSQNANGGNGKIESLIVPSTVTSIGEYAFGNCPALTEVYCKSTKIGSRMFIDCAKLSTVTLENTVEIGGNSFNRTPITSIVIPSTVTTVGDYAFKSCKSLTKVVILGSTMGPNMFYESLALNTLVLTEKFETFGSNALGAAPANGTFTIYYTGKDYDRVKQLGASSTSRFKDAKCYSYLDYVENNYTDRYMLIYETNLCVAAFDGVHTEPKDDGDCTTAVICSVCSDYTYKQAKQHIISERLTYSSFVEDGEYYVGCANDGCTYGTTEKASALFTCLGYSAFEVNNGGILVGFGVNDTAISKYAKVTGKDFKFGLFAGRDTKLGTNDAVNTDGVAYAGIASVDYTERGFDIVEIKVIGFVTDDHKNANLALGLYVIDGESISYVQATKPSESEKYSYVSYNDLIS